MSKAKGNSGVTQKVTRPESAQIPEDLLFGLGLKYGSLKVDKIHVTLGDRAEAFIDLIEGRGWTREKLVSGLEVYKTPKNDQKGTEKGAEMAEK